jgi:hypothetical protein
MWLEESGASMHTSGQLKVPPERLSEDNPDHSSLLFIFGNMFVNQEGRLFTFEKYTA